MLAVTGVILYASFSHDLDSTIDAGLRSRAADVAALARGSRPQIDLQRLPGRSGEGFAQVLDREGRIAGATPALQGRALLSAPERAMALSREEFIERPAGTAMRDASRLLATPLRSGGRRLIVVVGASTSARSDSLADLLGLLVAGGSVALLLAALAAYGGAAAALRPVEAMRARAAEISAAEPEERLPVPAAEDEIGRLGMTLNAMLGRLGEALARERRFVADASHELRTPLAILKAELELALPRAAAEGAPSERAPAERTREELEQALMSAAEETDRLTQLAEDLLTLAQTDEGTLLSARELLEPGELLEQVARRYESRCAEQGRTLELHCEQDLRVDGDALRLQQALGNLVDNSLRYGAGAIELLARRRAGVVEIHVADRGRGLPADFIEQAFERFTRVEHSSGTGGAGLGLSIAASIAGAHGGRARIVNREGGGADTWLELPEASYLKAPV